MKVKILFPFYSGLFSLSLILALSFPVPAQDIRPNDNNRRQLDWLEMMQDPGARFQDIVKAANAYYNRYDITQKGIGYKIFKRWEYIHESRVLPDGKLQSPGYVKQQYDQYMSEQDGMSSVSGNWTIVGPVAYPTNSTGQPTGMGRINAVAFHPTDAATIFIGAPSGGIWKSTDGGSTWTDLSANIPKLGVSAILVHPVDPAILYIGTGDRDASDAPGIGVFKSTNGGVSWTQVNQNMGNSIVGGLAMHPSDPNTILAATSKGIYKTIDGGSHWTQKSNNTSHYKEIRYNPGNPAIVYATEGGKFYRSSDGGESWTQLSASNGIPSAGSRMVIGVSSANPACVYLVQIKASDNTFSALLRSTDYGVNFTTRSTSPNIFDYKCDGSGTSTQATYDLCITVDPNNANTVFVGSINNWKSTDGGATWAPISHWVGSNFAPSDPTANCAESVHADQHWYEWNPLNGRLYVGNDGGLYWTANGGTNWTQISSGIAIAQVYKIGQSATSSAMTINGYQDNGAAFNNGSAFTTVAGGDAGEGAIDYTNTNYRYNASTTGVLRRTATGGNSYSTIANFNSNGIIGETSHWMYPFCLHETDPNYMFLGYKNVWRSANVKASTASSVTWSAISSGETSTCRVLEQSPADVNVLYAVRSGSLKRTDNAMDAAGLVTWAACTLPGGSTPTDLEAHPSNSSIVFATTDYKVFRSADKGATWADITGNLPSLFINTVVMDKNSNEGIYIGNQTGVWYKDATLSNWMLFSNGLPPVDVRELDIYYDASSANSRIKAATYGRGLWESDLAQVNVTDPTGFSAFVAGSAQINLGWTKNTSNDHVLLAWSSTGTFGQPAEGTGYSAGNTLPGGGTILYTGSATGYNHTGLSPSTRYYYKIWSVNGSNQYSAGVGPVDATTDCPPVSTFPYTCTFENTDCWQVIDHTGNRSWQFGSTTNTNNPPTILTAPYAYFKSTPGSSVSFNSDLFSPPFDLSSFSTALLKFNQHYDGDASWSSIARVYYTTDNGLNWSLLATYTTDQNNTPVVLLVPGAAGQSNVKFRWNYFDDATGSYMWGIDHVQVMECSGVWTGTAGTNWHTAGNWCNNSVPTAATDVIIPAGASNMPDISTTTVAYCRDITILSGATLKMSAASSVLEVKGNWSMYGSFDFTNSSASSMVTFNGSSLQAVGGGTYTRLRGLNIDNTSGITLSTELRADNSILLTNGVVTTTGTGKVYDVYNVIVRTNGWVNGTLQKYLWSGNTSVDNRTFQIGDATNYAPVSLSFPAGSITGTGAISMKTTTGDHPATGTSTLDGALSVNRYWSFPATVSFTSCTATLNFVSGDLDAGTLTGNLNAGINASGAWSYPALGTRTSTSTQVTGLASATLGDIQLAEPVPSVTWGNLQWPAGGNIVLGVTYTVYGQVYLGGVTPGAGAGAGMQCWIGYSTANTNPSGWTNWVPATYNTDSGNNDEYMANLGAAISSPGTWYYATRYRRGSSPYVYGGYSAGGGGFWDGSAYVSGVLTVAGPTFTGTGDWTDAARWNTGTVPASASNTIIDGACTVSSVVTTADLTINSGRSVTVASNGQFTVNGLLTNHAGNTGLVIQSDATGTGSLIHVTSAVAATAERHIANDWKWHFLSSPVSAQPVWNSFAPAPSGSPLSFGAAPWNWDFYYWNPNTDTTTGLYWVNLRRENGEYNNGTIDEAGSNAGFGSATPPVMIPGRGYLAAYNTGWTAGSPVTHLFTGDLNQGSVGYSLSVTSNKFNLAGNPYPSAIDWQATGGWSRGNLALNSSGYDYWIYNDNAGNYGVFNSGTGSGTNGTSRYIAPGQAFFVKAAAAGTLGMTDAVRAHSTQPWLKSEDDEPGAVRLHLTTNANSYSDEMVIAFNPAFVPGGSEKLRSFYDEAPELWSVGSGKEYSIVRYAQPTAELVIPVSIKAGTTAGYTLTAPGIGGFALSSRVFLEDLKTGTTQDLKSNPAYSFTASPWEQPERFRIHFGAPFGIGNDDSRPCFAIWITGKRIRIKSDKGCPLEGELSVFNILGQEVIRQSISGTDDAVTLSCPAGYFIVKIVTPEQTITRKIFIPM